MGKNRKNNAKTILTLGIFGLIAGIFLLFSDNMIIGIFGSIASGGLAFKAYKDLQDSKNE